jgi:S-adenosylmethionine:tRNA ribosyltransferase-isomerase
MQLSDFNFELPAELIAQNPPENRTDSRLLVPQSSDVFSEVEFSQIGTFLQAGDLLVMNDTKVIPARLFGVKETGGKVEIMIERLLSKQSARVMIRASRAPKINSLIILDNSETARILEKEAGFYILEFSGESLLDLLDKVGHIPLPPYINRTDEPSDLSRYQTVYAEQSGAVAAPTAGLHFDENLLKSLEEQGIDHCFVTLHVGAGTFQPVKVDDIKTHKMHREVFEISQNTVDKIKQTKAQGGRIVAVGTTSVRTLESVVKQGELKAQSGETDIFIYPGFKFQVVDKLITNFHLPKSSLLMLVGAFMGKDKMFELYQYAIEKKYRFFSYGDAMLLSKQ